MQKALFQNFEIKGERRPRGAKAEADGVASTSKTPSKSKAGATRPERTGGGPAEDRRRTGGIGIFCLSRHGGLIRTRRLVCPDASFDQTLPCPLSVVPRLPPRRVLPSTAPALHTQSAKRAGPPTSFTAWAFLGAPAVHTRLPSPTEPHGRQPPRLASPAPAGHGGGEGRGPAHVGPEPLAAHLVKAPCPTTHSR